MVLLRSRVLATSFLVGFLIAFLAGLLRSDLRVGDWEALGAVFFPLVGVAFLVGDTERDWRTGDLEALRVVDRERERDLAGLAGFLTGDLDRDLDRERERDLEVLEALAVSAFFVAAVVLALGLAAAAAAAALPFPLTTAVVVLAFPLVLGVTAVLLGLAAALALVLGTVLGLAAVLGLVAAAVLVLMADSLAAARLVSMGFPSFLAFLFSRWMNLAPSLATALSADRLGFAAAALVVLATFLGGSALASAESSFLLGAISFSLLCFVFCERVVVCV